MKKKVKKFIFPGLGLIASVWFSFVFAIGAITAFFASEIFMKKYFKTGVVKEIKIGFRNWEVHLHHWILAILIMAGVAVIDTISALPIIILGFLNGLIFHDIYTDKKWRTDNKKWYQFIYRKESIY